MRFADVGEENLSAAGYVHSESWKESHRGFCSAEFVAWHTPQAQTDYLRRELAAGKLDLPGAEARLAQIRQMSTRRAVMLTAASAAGSACFAYLFGGFLAEAAVALVAGVAESLLSQLCRRKKISRIFSDILSAAAGTAVALVCKAVWPGLDADTAIIGALMVLTPGVSLTGEIGMIAGCRLVPSKKVPLATGVYTCPIVKLEADPEVDDEIPALTIYRKRDVNIETERKPKTRTTEITADEFYVAVLSNEAKVVLAKFKEK